MLRITINGAAHEIDIAADTPLLWVLRDTLALKGTKYGCGVGICGSCTVLVDGEAARSCMVALGEVGEREITTIEGLAARGHPVLSAWIDEQVAQCGYCQPAQILSAMALLQEHPQPSDADIDRAMADVLCRCGTYHRIRRAVHRAAGQRSGAAQPVAAVPAPAEPGVALDDWLRIACDGTVTVTINHAEMGQGVSTALAALVAEELEVNLDRVRIAYAPADVRYRNPMFGEQTTGGSTSVRGEWDRLSEAGAKARVRLVQAAAQQWAVDVQECVAEEGAVRHRPSNRRLDYGELAVAAANIEPPKRVALKPADQCRLLGKDLRRLDIPDIVAGRTVYGLDLALPDMRVAAVARCPTFGGRVARFDAAAASALPGVERVVEIGRGVAVVAEDLPTALRGRAAVQVTWDHGPHADLNGAAIDAQLSAALERQGNVHQEAGDPEPVWGQGHRIVEAEYATAPLAHGTLEPMNCAARVTGDACEVWVGTQSPESARKAAARVSGLSPDQVQVHSQDMGGSFGRRLETDTVEEAVELAKRIGAPVQVAWDRTDDLQHDFYRPAYRARLRAALDEHGRPLAWWQRGAGQSVAGEAHAQLAYGIPNVRTEFVTVESPLPAGAWRAVGAGQDAFAVESFIDELAHAAGKDPFEYRRGLLQDAPRHLAVLEWAAELAAWREPPPAGRHRGIAVYRSFGSYVAEVAEVSVANRTVRVHRVLCAAECGRIANPDGVRAQLEGAIAMGMSAALKEAVTIEHGGVVQRTFRDYPILTLAEMPQVEVHIVQSDEPPGGAGEPGLPPLAPALANAIAVATGKRLRAMPFRLSGD